MFKLKVCLFVFLKCVNKCEACLSIYFLTFHKLWGYSFFDGYVILTHWPFCDHMIPNENI